MSVANVPLLWRVFLANALVLVLSAGLLAGTPFTISAPIATNQATVLGVGLAAMLVANLLLLRRAMSPLRRLTKLMAVVDLLEPGRRLETSSSHQPADLAAVTDSFNAMLERLEAERRDSSRRVLSAQEGERLRIARELHDELGQVMTAIVIETERLTAQAPAELRPNLVRQAAWVQQSLEALRRITRDLRPEALDDLGLVNAFIALCKRAAEQSGLEVERRLAPSLPERGAEVDLVLYRVAQESLTNVMRHADANYVLVELLDRDGRLVLRVEDDGRGFDPDGVALGAGIAGMRERALLIGAQVQIDSRPGAGTRVVLDLPLKA